MPVYYDAEDRTPDPVGQEIQNLDLQTDEHNYRDLEVKGSYIFIQASRSIFLPFSEHLP